MPDIIPPGKPGGRLRLPKFAWRRFLLPIILLALAALLPWLYLTAVTHPHRYTLSDEVPSAPVAIVFGAGLTREGTPSAYLTDRVTTAADLYKRGLATKLIMSGDNRSAGYNEPEAMKTLAVSLGVPAQDIVLDYAGLRSYDTCYRARHIFGVRKAIVVTQEYHLPRTVYSCNQLGIETTGISANRREYLLLPFLWFQFREVLACGGALLDLHLLHPQPVLGPMEIIDFSSHRDGV